MKKLLFLFLFAFSLISPLSGQIPTYQNVVFVNTAPSGACTNGSAIQAVVSTGLLYTCQNGTWEQAGSTSGGSGTGFPTQECLPVQIFYASDTGQYWDCTQPDVWENRTTGVTSSGANPVNSGLQARYRMVDASGTNLPDTSGNGYNGTMGLNVWASPAITSSGLLFTSPFNSGGTQGVALPTTFFTSSQTIIVYYQPSNTFPAAYPQYVLSPATSTSYVDMIGPSVTDGAPLIGNSGNPTTAGSSQLWQGMVPAAFTLPVGANAHIYLQGTETSYNYQTTVTAQASTTYLELGAQAYADYSGFTGTIAYLEFYSSVLTPAQITQECAHINVELYQRGITLGNQAIKKNTQIIVDGTSISMGYNLNASVSTSNRLNDPKDGWFGQLESIMGSNNYSWHDLGIGGQFLSSALSKIQSAIISPITSYAGPSIVIAEFPTNDIVNNVTQATLQTNITSYCTTVKATGAKCIVTTVLPRNAVSPFSTNRATYNAWIDSNWQTFSDGVIDWASDPIIGPDSASSDSTLYFDNTHPSAIATKIMSKYAAAEISRVISANSSFLPNSTASIASASTIQLTSNYAHITGSSAISTMTPPAGFSVPYCVTLIADGAWTTVSGTGNYGFKKSTNQSVGAIFDACLDGNNLWYTVPPNTAPYMSATATASQTTGLTAGSTVLFTSVVQAYGSDITLNTTTGVFTLAAGHTYELRGAVPSVVSSNSGNQSAFQWYNVTTSSYIGSGQGIYAPTSSAYNIAGGMPIADIATGASAVTVKLNLAYVSQAISSIGSNVDFSGVTMFPYATIRELW